MVEELGVSFHAVFDGKIGRIGKIEKLEKWVPHDLNDRQKFSRFDVCSSLLLCNYNDPFSIGSSRVMKSGSSTTT